MARQQAGHLHDHGSEAGLVSVEDARGRVLERIQPLAPIELPLQEAHGCVIADHAVN